MWSNTWLTLFELSIGFLRLLLLLLFTFLLGHNLLPQRPADLPVGECHDDEWHEQKIDVQEEHKAAFRRQAGPIFATLQLMLCNSSRVRLDMAWSFEAYLSRWSSADVTDTRWVTWVGRRQTRRRRWCVARGRGFGGTASTGGGDRWHSSAPPTWRPVSRHSHSPTQLSNKWEER